MFRSALGLGPVFLFVAVISALFGFGTASSGAGDVAQVVFAVFLALAVLSFVGVCVCYLRDAYCDRGVGGTTDLTRMR